MNINFKQMSRKEREAIKFILETCDSTKLLNAGNYTCGIWGGLYNDINGALNEDWFDSIGQLIRDIPAQCIDELSSPGSHDKDIIEWIKKLGFYAPREEALKYMYNVGQTDDLEDYPEREEEVNQFILWDICCHLSENPKEGYSLDS